MTDDVMKVESPGEGEAAEALGIENADTYGPDASGDAADCDEDEAGYGVSEGGEDNPVGEADEDNAGEGGTEPRAEIDYAALEREDLGVLARLFPETRGLNSIAELPRAERYAELRDLGLSAKEAYLATREVRRTDSRSHLSSAVPKSAGAPSGGMTRSELERARELFPGLGDRELQGLYKKVRA